MGGRFGGSMWLKLPTNALFWFHWLGNVCIHESCSSNQRGFQFSMLPSVLSKPLQWPHTNGVILRYAASCWDELDSSYRDCGHLDSNSSSCVLSLSAHACNCNLTASNSAGTSPSAHIYLPRDKDAGE